MSPLAIALAVGTVIGMATGQILFKLASGRGSLMEIFLSPVFWVAIVLYGVVTLLWVLLLREIDLSRAYPILAGTYVLVPIASMLLLGEKLEWSYGLGVALIIVGIVLTVRA